MSDDRPPIPEDAQIHVLWSELRQQAMAHRGHVETVNERLKAQNHKIEANADKIDDLRLWRAKLMGAVLMAGALGGGVGAAFAKIFGG